jgi:hypothetical protein
MAGRTAPALATLTDGQRRMLALVAVGATTADLARHLGMPPRGVGRELASLLTDLGVPGRREAALLWWGSRAGARVDLRDASEALSAVRRPGNSRVGSCPRPDSAPAPMGMRPSARRRGTPAAAAAYR